MFDIDDTAITTGNIFDYATSVASTGTIFEVTLANAVGAILQNFTLSGARTANASVITHSASGSVDVFQIDDSGTSSGHVFDINTSGNSTGNVIDIVASTSKVAGHFLNMDLATDLAGNAINIAAAGARTAPIINIANAGTDGGTDDHVIFISQTGLLDSNLVQLTFGTAASTGEAISIVMDTNVAGRALAVSSAGTGVTGEGCVIDVEHTGALVAGADAVTVHSTSNLSSTSNLVAIEQDTGAGTAGANALYISATGTNVEALHINAGLFFEAVVALATGAGNGETISVAGNVAYYDCGGASRTGVILAAGLRDGQVLKVVNSSDGAETITFAASGTSNVALGASTIIEQNTCQVFVWSGAQAPVGTQNLWFPTSA